MCLVSVYFLLNVNMFHHFKLADTCGHQTFYTGTLLASCELYTFIICNLDLYFSLISVRAVCGGADVGGCSHPGIVVDGSAHYKDELLHIYPAVCLLVRGRHRVGRHAGDDTTRRRLQGRHLHDDGDRLDKPHPHQQLRGGHPL